ncbi:PAS domain S-box protein [Roseovarius aestuarii]|nr:PAS domain S-box protein [Roseovarius aestuarii]
MGESLIIDAFMHMQVPLMIVGPDGVIHHCNQASSRLFGYEDNTLNYLSVFDVLSVKTMSELSAYIEPPAYSAVITDLPGINQSGTPIPLLIQLTAWTDTNGDRQHALAMRDIAEDVKAARLSREELKRAHNAINGARIGVFEYDCETGKLSVSDMWRELMELDGSETQPLMEEWRSRVHPHDAETVTNLLQDCLNGESERVSCEYRTRSKDGKKWRWVSADMAVSKRDAEGKVVQATGAMSDITERKKIELAYHRIAKQFRSSFENATIGKAVVGLEGEFLQVNTALCEILGYTEEELFKTNFQTLTHPDDLVKDLEQFKRLKAGETSSYQTEKRYLRSNGAVMWGLVSVGMVVDSNGKPDHFISQIVDVTEQRRLDELKDQFVATVSHELRTPLTSLLGSLSLLSSTDAFSLPDSARKLIGIAQKNGSRLESLVNDILDFEKFSARQMRYSLSDHPISNLIEDAISLNRPYAQKFGVQFETRIVDKELKGLVDPKRFQQVMSNLLSNAAKFANDGSVIDVTLEKADDDIKVSVTNYGSGISKEFRKQIFKPFSQDLPTNNQERGGTGLGLSITKKIIEQTGGAIDFDSEENGKTTFWFTVPISKVSA